MNTSCNAAEAAIKYLKTIVRMHDEWNEVHPEIAASEERFGYARGIHSAIKAIENELEIAGMAPAADPEGLGFYTVETRDGESFLAYFSRSGWRFPDGFPMEADVLKWEVADVTAARKMAIIRSVRYYVGRAAKPEMGKEAANV